MVKTIILRYIFAEKLCIKGTLNFVIACILLSVILFAVTSDIDNSIAIIVIMLLILVSTIMREYNAISQAEYTSTPLVIITGKYIELVTRKDLISFLGINTEEQIDLKALLKEYEEAVDLLGYKGKNRD